MDRRSFPPYFSGCYSSAELQQEIDKAYENGYAAGYKDGEDKAYDNGYNTGYKVGAAKADSEYKKGYNEGYAAGEKVNEDSLLAIITSSQHTYTYVLNTNTDKFHYADCSSVKRMKAENTKYYTGTRDQVVSMGYAPCSQCKP